MKYNFPFLTICLLDACNKNCKHCYRTAIPGGHDFKLTFDETKKAIANVNSLGFSCMFAGGEPTIWSDGATSFVDLLNYAGKLHGEVWFISNGRIFEDRMKAKTFFEKLETSFKLRIIFSIDGIHENYNREQSILGLIEEYSEIIGKEVLGQIMNSKESIRFAGCSICSILYKSGAFEKINRLLLAEDKQL